MDVLCPKCQEPMRWLKGSFYSCPLCQNSYKQICLCPQCKQPLERLQACGAVDYFCNYGHGLISKHQAIYQFEPLV